MLDAGTVLGPYRVVSLLGAGGMGEVYEAEDMRLKRRAAVKVLRQDVVADRDRLARFSREAEAVAALNHPAIVTIYGLHEQDEMRFLGMELVEGKTLDRVIPESGLPTDRLLEIATTLAEAVGAAHRQGVIHRDLKPANVMLSSDGAVKILDFGLAKLMPSGAAGARDDRTATLTEVGTLLGTVPYMAPEQLRGETVDERSDIFSLGAVLYEATCGRRPFSAASQPELVSSILRDTPPPPSAIRTGVPPGLDRLVLRCLEKEPALRYMSCADLLTELAGVESGAEPVVRAPASVAVLPFADMSPGRDQGYFCEGIAEELIHALSRLEGLEVASRTSAFQFRDHGRDIREIGSRLGVGTILEGSVRKSGTRVRITAQLIKTGDGYHLWSGQYDRDLEDIFTVQDEISAAIVEKLTGVWTEVDHEAVRARRTRSAEAYDYYLRGRHLFYQKRRQSFARARQMFDRAIEMDSDYALAYAGIADSAAFLHMWWGKDPEDLEIAERASLRAVELGPELAEARASRGLVLSLSGRYPLAAAEFEAAIRLDPGNFEALYLYGRMHFAQGDFEKTAELFRRASEVRSEDYQALALLGLVLRALGRVDEAEEVLRQGVARADRALELDPEDARAHYLSGGSLVYLGEVERGLRRAERAIRIDAEDPFILWNVACVHSVAGRIEQAIDLLETAYGLGFGHRAWVEHDPDMDPLRDHPRFQALLAKLK